MVLMTSVGQCHVRTAALDADAHEGRRRFIVIVLFINALIASHSSHCRFKINQERVEQQQQEQ